ncbi:MAG: hypothetical protein PVG38_17590 [Gammaproteobacteria bacterium]|jgi:hypothetical protein
MKKHRYSAKNIKQANWAKISAETTGQRRVVFGVDVAKEKFFGVLMQEDRSVIATLKWVHPEQTRELGEHLLQAVPAQRLEVVMEPSGTYADALQRYLCPVSTILSGQRQLSWRVSCRHFSLLGFSSWFGFGSPYAGTAHGKEPVGRVHVRGPGIRRVAARRG